jgi:flavin-dependent dehydrogenase
LTARELARRGLTVLLVDRVTFPRRKVCGCCMNGAALGVLDAVGLSDLAVRLGAVPLSGALLAAGPRSARLRLPAGVAVSREAFDAALVSEAVAAGATFLPGVRASVIRPGTATRRELDLAFDGRSIRVAPPVVVAADGIGSPTVAALAGTGAVPAGHSRIGASVVAPSAPAFFESGTVFMAVGRGGYVGAVRLEDGRLDLAAAFDAAFVRQMGGAGPAAAAILGETDWPPICSVEALPWKGTPPLTRRPPAVAGPGWFAVGDAAGYVEPFTGEGIGWALASAVAVAPIVAGVLRTPRPTSRPWPRVYDALVRGRQRRCRAVAAALRRPELVAAAVGLLARFPEAAGPVLRGWNRPLSVRGQSA